MKKCELFVKQKKQKLFCIELWSPEQNRTWYLSAGTDQDREEWINSISYGKITISEENSKKILVLGSRNIPNSPKGSPKDSPTGSPKTSISDTALDSILDDSEFVDREIVRSSSFSRSSLTAAQNSPGKQSSKKLTK